MEEVDYSTIDVERQMKTMTPDNAVYDDPQDEDFEADDESSDGESDKIGDSNKLDKFTQQPIGSK